MKNVYWINDDLMKTFQLPGAEERGGLYIQPVSLEKFQMVSESVRDSLVVLSEPAMCRLLQMQNKVKRQERFLVLSWNKTSYFGLCLEGQLFCLTEPKGKEEVVEALKNIVHKLEEKHNEANFEKMVLEEADRVKPIIKERFLRDYILGEGDTSEIFHIYCKTFDVDAACSVRLILMKPSEPAEYDDTFFLKNMIEKYIGEEDIFLSTIVQDHILVVIADQKKQEIVRSLERVKKAIKKCYGYDMVAFYSNATSIAETQESYEQLKECLGYSFYTDGSEIFSSEEISIGGGKSRLMPNYGGIERAVRSGDFAKTKLLLCDFFNDVIKATPAPAVAKTYCLELYVCMIRCCSIEKIDKYMKGIVTVQELRSLNEIKQYMMEKAEEIVESIAPKTTRVYSSLIKETMEIIEQNLGNENLSLRWLAGTILYTNVDYLGKLFKKETGMNFSHYVMEKRMEMAKQLIIDGKKDRIYEVAEKVGYGSNSQYFSQVFKKYTGVSPLEYKEYARLSFQAAE